MLHHPIVKVLSKNAAAGIGTEAAAAADIGTEAAAASGIGAEAAAAGIGTELVKKC